MPKLINIQRGRETPARLFNRAKLSMQSSAEKRRGKWQVTNCWKTAEFALKGDKVSALALREQPPPSGEWFVSDKVRTSKVLNHLATITNHRKPYFKVLSLSLFPSFFTFPPSARSKARNLPFAWFYFRQRFCVCSVLQQFFDSLSSSTQALTLTGNTYTCS